MNTLSGSAALAVAMSAAIMNEVKDFIGAESDWLVDYFSKASKASATLPSHGAKPKTDAAWFKVSNGCVMSNAVAPFCFDNFSPLLNDWSTQRMHGVPRGYTLIDEVDFFSDRMRERLRAFIDSTELGTIIATTNNLHLLDDPFKDRFRKLYIERPTSQNWVQRAHAILASEGVNLTTQQVSILLNGFEGSARSLLEWLEDYALALKSTESPIATRPKSAYSVKAIAGKTLINGRPLLS